MKKILAVDNNSIVLEFMKDLLTEKGHRVMTAEDGLSALNMLKESVPDIVFVDLIMPNIGGKKLCQIIRTMPEMRDVYLVILSAVAVEEKIDLAATGANAYIAKAPFEKMGRHILDILEKAEQLKDAKEEIRGLEDVFPREITRELLCTKSHFEAILEGMLEGIVETTPEGRIVYANPAAISLIGIAEEKLLGTDVLELFEGPDREGVERVLNSTDGGVRKTEEGRLLSLNRRLVSMTAIGVNGDARRSIIILHDQTERKQIEWQLLKAQKLEAVGTLAGGIAHDFNNILMAIMGNISIAQRLAGPGDAIFERLLDAEEGCSRAKELTRRFMNFTKEETPIRTTASMGEVLKNSITLILSGSNVQSDVSIPEELWQCEFDAGQVSSVFNTVLSNAKEAMPEGGVITVEAENATIGQEEVRRGLHVRKGRYVKVSIHDQGNGIPEKNLPIIFDPYFSTKERGSQKGMGLSLAIAHSIVKQHEGDIEVKSDHGVGTTFTVYLPAVKEAKPPQDEEARETSISGQGRALVMDDEKIVREAVAMMLSQTGYEVETAEEGSAAIDCYKKAWDSGEPFDIVILDLTVPGGLGGKEVIQELLGINPEIKAIVSSGYRDDPVMTGFRRFGFRAAIAKPYTLAELSRTLNEVTKKRSE